MINNKNIMYMLMKRLLVVGDLFRFSGFKNNIYLWAQTFIRLWKGYQLFLFCLFVGCVFWEGQ